MSPAHVGDSRQNKVANNAVAFYRFKCCQAGWSGAGSLRVCTVCNLVLGPVVQTATSRKEKNHSSASKHCGASTCPFWLCLDVLHAPIHLWFYVSVLEAMFLSSFPGITTSILQGSAACALITRDQRLDSSRPQTGHRTHRTRDHLIQLIRGSFAASGWGRIEARARSGGATEVCKILLLLHPRTVNKYICTNANLDVKRFKRQSTAEL